MVDDISLPSRHGGIIFPLSMFRPTMLAAVMAESLVAQARNILDARLVLTRHPEIQLVLAHIEGSIIGDNPATFWRENAELGMVASQVMPQQLIQYWYDADEPRQGFIVAQRGQALAAQDATEDQMPAGSTAQDWPVAQLLAQMQLAEEELANGFAGGPQVSCSLMERDADDREMLMTLAGQPAEGEGEDPNAAAGGPGPGPDAPGGPGPSPDAPGQAPAKPKRATVEDDKKRRAAEAQAEQEARQARADSMRADLPHVIDELGVVAAPKGAELADTDILEPFMVRAIAGDLPAGLPRELTDELQGKRVDFAVVVEFLSEVFVEEGPLSKPHFETHANPHMIGGQEVRALEVLAPRLGRGTFVRRGYAGAFVSRTPDQALPEALIIALLDSQD